MNSFIDWFSFFNDRKQQRKKYNNPYKLFRVSCVVRHTIETTVLLRHRKIVPMNVARHWIISKLSHFSVCFVVDFNSMSGGHLQRKQYYIFSIWTNVRQLILTCVKFRAKNVNGSHPTLYIPHTKRGKSVLEKIGCVHTENFLDTNEKSTAMNEYEEKKSIRNATTYVVAYVQVCWFAARRLQFFFYSFLSVSLYQQQYVFTPAVGTYGHINALFFLLLLRRHFYSMAEWKRRTKTNNT